MKPFFYVCLILQISISSISLTQDPHYSQNYAGPIGLNPALTGTANSPRVVTQYRNQWPGLSGNFVTYHAAYDQKIEAINSGMGVMVYFLVTFPAFVFETNCFFAPCLFFFLAVEARSALDILFAFFNGKQRSGFFLFLLVPHSPRIEPSVPILTHFSSRHFLSSPTFLRFFQSYKVRLSNLIPWRSYSCDFHLLRG